MVPEIEPSSGSIAIVLYRLEQGHVAHIKSVGKGVSEYKIDFGPGYLIYFGRKGNFLMILLGGGSKRTQGKDILNAQRL